MTRRAIFLYAATISLALAANCFVETPLSASKGADLSTFICPAVVLLLLWVFAVVASWLDLFAGQVARTDDDPLQNRSDAPRRTR